MSTEINYNDERFAKVESDKNAALGEMEQTYSGIIDQSDKFYQAQIDASKDWQKTQSDLQQQQSDFVVNKIEQDKAQAKKDYTKEQAGAYVDWKKQSNQFGANAEQLASQGLKNDGYSESSQVGMYNTYQNRVATARETFNKAVLNYDNSIAEARLQNNSALAEIAFQGLQQQLELSLQGFQFKNSLLLEQANKKQSIDSEYWGRYQDVLAQMNHEISLAEQIRQYNEQMEWDKYQFNFYNNLGEFAPAPGNPYYVPSDKEEEEPKVQKEDSGRISGGIMSAHFGTPGIVPEEVDTTRRTTGAGGAPWYRLKK